MLTCRAFRAQPTCPIRSRSCSRRRTSCSVYEYAVRSRGLNMDSPTKAPTDTWMGWSNGHWEGDTLVVDVTGLNGRDLVRPRRATSIAIRLHVVERYTPPQPLIHYVRGDHRGSEDVFAALEDQHAAVPARRKERAAHGIQVRRVLEEVQYGHLRKQPLNTNKK